MATNHNVIDAMELDTRSLNAKQTRSHGQNTSKNSKAQGSSQMKCLEIGLEGRPYTRGTHQKKGQSRGQNHQAKQKQFKRPSDASKPEKRKRNDDAKPPNKRFFVAGKNKQASSEESGTCNKQSQSRFFSSQTPSTKPNRFFNKDELTASIHQTIRTGRDKGLPTKRSITLEDMEV